MISAKDELFHAISTLGEQEAEEALVLLSLLWGHPDPDTRQATLDFIHLHVPEFFGDDGPYPRSQR